MNTTNAIISLSGRILLSALFLSAGLSKLGAGYAGTQGYMESMGVPGVLLPLVIITEIVGALMIIVGFKTKIAAFLLAGFSIISALIFHANFADQMQSILFMKNFSIAGGLLMLLSHGAGQYSVDAFLSKK